MIRVMLVGALGKMGQKVIEAINNSNAFTLVSAVDKGFLEAENNTTFEGVETISNISYNKSNADCLIDFSFHTSAKEISKFIIDNKIPAVIATTGHTKEEIEAIKGASSVSPVFFSGNLSIGVGLTSKLACEVSKMFPDSDCEIVETHHNKKADSPSGTALMIANDIIGTRGKGTIISGRQGMSKRQEGDIGISSVRLANIVGQHSVIFDTGTQQIEIKHTSHDRSLFAQGALQAAQFIVNKPPKLYRMEDLLCE